MKMKHVVLSIVLLIVVNGCAHIDTKYVDTMGRKLPNPSYTMNPIGTKMSVTFYYAGIKSSTDIDGSIIQDADFFSMFETHQIFAKKYSYISLFIIVDNPDEVEYSLCEKLSMNIGLSYKYKEVQKGGKRNRSNKPHRQFVYYLPFEEDVVDVDHLMIMMIDKNPVIQMGSFRYHLIH